MADNVDQTQSPQASQFVPPPKEDRLNFQKPEYRDPAYAIAFIIHLIAVIVLCIITGPKLTEAIKGATSSTTTTTTSSSSNDEVNTFFGSVLVSAVAGGVFAAVWIQIMKLYSATIITITFAVFAAADVALAIFGFAQGATALGVVMLIVLALHLIYYYFIRYRIPFSSAIINASCQALQTHSGPIYASYLLLFLSIGWVALWAFTFVSTLYVVNDPTMSRVLAVLLMISYYWTMNAIEYVGHVTTSGVVATWWLAPNNDAPTKGAFKRATTTSFGSVCMGALIIALLQTARALARSARKSPIGCIALCLLSCIEGLIRIFNFYGFVYVAVYGLRLSEAGKATWELFNGKGFTLLINADLSGMVCALGSLLASLVGLGIAIAWSTSAKLSIGMTIAACFFSWLIAFLVCALTMIVVRSAIATTFVLWAEDPAAISQTRKEHYDAIEGAAGLFRQNPGSLSP